MSATAPIYVLDTNVIIRDPELLAKQSKTVQVAIPYAVIEELSLRRGGSHQLNLEKVLQSASEKGVQTLDTPKVPLEGINIPRRFRLRGADLDLLKIAINAQLEKGSRNVCIVTDDKYLLETLKLAGLAGKTREEFLQIVSAQPENESIKEIAQQYKKSQFRSILFSVIAGVLSSVLAEVVRRYYQEILNFFSDIGPAWVSCILIFAVGALLFAFRQRMRTSYGILEVFVGIVTASIPVLAAESYSVFRITEGLQVLAGLYIIVRGLDNIGTGLKGTRYEPSWKRLFPSS